MMVLAIGSCIIVNTSISDSYRVCVYIVQFYYYERVAITPALFALRVAIVTDSMTCNTASKNCSS